MPDVAVVDGVRIVSTEMEPAAWEDLRVRLATKQTSARFPSCNRRALARTSTGGHQHFYHRDPQLCPVAHAPESKEHSALALKVLHTCLGKGWGATREAYLPPRIADVLAERAGNRFAFEVQWSPQSVRVTRERSADYQMMDIRPVWLFRKLPAGHGGHHWWPTAALATELVSPAEVMVGPARLPLDAFVAAVLDGDLVFVPTAELSPESREDWAIGEYCCPCGTRNICFQRRSRTILRSRCQNLVEEEHGAFAPASLTSAAQAWARAELGAKFFDKHVSAMASGPRNPSRPRLYCRACKQRINIGAANLLCEKEERIADGAGGVLRLSRWHWCKTQGENKCRPLVVDPGDGWADRRRRRSR